MLELKIQPDHIHLALSIPPSYAMSNGMGFLKGKLPLRGFQRCEQLGKRYCGQHLWLRGHCVSTVALDEDKIRKYVNWHEARHTQAEHTQKRLFDWGTVGAHRPGALV